MSDTFHTDKVLKSGLEHARTGPAREVINNPDLFAFVLAQFNNTLKLASGRPADIVLGLTNKTLATGKLVGKSTQSQGVVVGITAAQILVTSASLLSVAGKGPAGAMIMVGAVFAKKTSLAFGLAGSDDKQAKCLSALADLAASGLTTAAVAPAAATGIGAVLLAGSIAQLVLSAYQAHNACIAPR